MKYEYKLLRQFTTMVGAIYGLNRARETHCRATRSARLNALNAAVQSKYELLSGF